MIFLLHRNPIKLSLGTLLMVPGGDELSGMLGNGFDKNSFHPRVSVGAGGTSPLFSPAQPKPLKVRIRGELKNTEHQAKKASCTHIFKWASWHSFLFFWMSQWFYYWGNRAHGRRSTRVFCGTQLRFHLVNAVCLFSLDARKGEDIFSRNKCLFWFHNTHVPRARWFMPSHRAPH